jgi:hypothetical protein
MTCIPLAPPMSRFHFPMRCGSGKNGVKPRVTDATKAMIIRLLALLMISFSPQRLASSKWKGLEFVDL